MSNKDADTNLEYLLRSLAVTAVAVGQEGGHPEDKDICILQDKIELMFSEQSKKLEVSLENWEEEVYNRFTDKQFMTKEEFEEEDPLINVSADEVIQFIKTLLSEQSKIEREGFKDDLNSIDEALKYIEYAESMLNITKARSLNELVEGKPMPALYGKLQELKQKYT